jgi:hypothetical protein
MQPAKLGTPTFSTSLWLLTSLLTTHPPEWVSRGLPQSRGGQAHLQDCRALGRNRCDGTHAVTARHPDARITLPSCSVVPNGTSANPVATTKWPKLGGKSAGNPRLPLEFWWLPPVRRTVSSWVLARPLSSPDHWPRCWPRSPEDAGDHPGSLAAICQIAHLDEIEDLAVAPLEVVVVLMDVGLSRSVCSSSRMLARLTMKVSPLYSPNS